MKYIEIETGDESKALIIIENIKAVIKSGNVVEIKYDTDSIRLTFTPRQSTCTAENLQNVAYANIKKYLGKL